MSFLSQLWSLVHNCAERKKAPDAPRCRPALEILEDRCTPSTLSGHVFGVAPGWTSGESGVYVELDGKTSAGLYVHQLTKTGAGGAYSFTGLQSGVYEILLLDKPIYHEGSLRLISVVPGTVNGQTDGVGQNDGDYGMINNISLGANAAGVNYNFFNSVDVFSGG
jgi:hypothetical protein